METKVIFICCLANTVLHSIGIQDDPLVKNGIT